MAIYWRICFTDFLYETTHVRHNNKEIRFVLTMYLRLAMMFL